MKIYVTAFVVLLATSLTFAQFEEPKKISFEISEPYRVVDATSKNYFQRGKEVLSVKIVKSKAIVQKFDGNGMKAGLKRELELPKSYLYEGLIDFSNKIILLYSIWNKDRQSEQLFYREIDFASGNWKGSPKKIIATRGKLSGPAAIRTSYFSAGVLDKFNFEFSPDDSKMMVRYRKVPKVKSDAKNYDVIGLYVFDSDLQELWGDEIKMPYTEKKMNNEDYSVDADGNAYILASVYEDNTTREKKKGSDEANYHFELIKRAPEDKKLQISKIDLDGKFITSVSIYETVDDLMVLAGFYNTSVAYRDAEGIFYAKVDKEGTLYDKQSHAIPLEILNQYEGKRTRKRNEKDEKKGKSDFANLKLRKLQYLSDGSIIFIGEQYFIASHTTTSSNGSTSTYYTYHYNDLLMAKVDPSGGLAWMQKLPKSQVGRNGRGTMSFSHFYRNGFHYLLFLDQLENAELPFDQAPRTYGDGKFGHLTAFVVDDNSGEASREIILDMRNAKGIKLYQFWPSKIFMVAENEFMFEAYKKKKEDVMVKIKIEE